MNTNSTIKALENKIAKARIELQKERANKDRILRPFAGKGLTDDFDFPDEYYASQSAFATLWSSEASARRPLSSPRKLRTISSAFNQEGGQDHNCSINLAEEYAHGHITFCIRGGLPIHWVFIGVEGDLYFYHRMHSRQQAKGYMKPTQMEIESFINYFNSEIIGYNVMNY